MFSLFMATETDKKSLFLAPEIVIFCQILGPEKKEPETDVMVQFLALEIVIMVKRNFMLSWSFDFASFLAKLRYPLI